MTRYFITGTDTGCGKTEVTCHLLKSYRQQGLRVLGVKPVASGCQTVSGQLVHEDVERLQAVNNAPAIEIAPWRFTAPLSPHLAAKRDGQSVTAEEIVTFCQQKAFNAYDTVLIEGAGGLMVPLNDQETWLDFLIKSQVPVILVVGMRLGCLNHAILTEGMLTRHGITCAGWVANCLDNTMLALEDNIQTLQKKLTSPLMAVIAYDSTRTANASQSEGDVVKHLHTVS